MDRKELLRGLSLVSWVILPRPVVPVTACVRIRSGFIEASNYNNWIRVPVEIESDELVIPFSELEHFCKSATDETVHIRRDGINYTLECGRLTLEVQGEENDTFPPVSFGEYQQKIEGGAMKVAMDHIWQAVGTDDDKPDTQLVTIRASDGIISFTAGNKLMASRYACEGEGKHEAFAPAFLLKKVSDVSGDQVELGAEDTYFYVRSSGVEIAQLSQDVRPLPWGEHFQKVPGLSHRKTSFEAQDMRRACQYVVVFSPDNPICSFEFGQDMCKVSGESIAGNRGDTNIDVSGEEATARMNSRLLIKGIRSMEGEVSAMIRCPGPFNGNYFCYFSDNHGRETLVMPVAKLGTV